MKDKTKPKEKKPKEYKQRDNLGRFSENNTFAKGLTTNGRPPVFSTPEEMESKACEYFESLITESDDGFYVKPSTITGVALFLGFNSRQGFYEYSKRPVFSDIVTRIQLAVENSYEKNLNSKFATGATFALKNMGWKDKQEIDNKLSGSIERKLDPSQLKDAIKEVIADVDC